MCSAHRIDDKTELKSEFTQEKSVEAGPLGLALSSHGAVGTAQTPLPNDGFVRAVYRILNYASKALIFKQMFVFTNKLSAKFNFYICMLLNYGKIF